MPPTPRRARRAALHHREPEQIAIVIRQAIEVARDQTNRADMQRRAAGKGGRGGGIGCVHVNLYWLLPWAFQRLVWARRVGGEQAWKIGLADISGIRHISSRIPLQCMADWTACAVRRARIKIRGQSGRFSEHIDWNLLHAVLGQAAVRFAAFFALMVMPAPGARTAVRAPAVVRDRKIPGFWPSGDNYSIKNPVISNGLLRIYTLTTPYGEFTVHGDQMLRMRINELAALYELEKIANSESYGKALLDAGLSPFKYTGRLITDPKKTVGDTMSGIGTMFGRISSDLANIGKTPGDPISGLLGVTDQRRKLATKVKIDPYTDFPPLDAKLSRLSEAAVAGGLTVSAAMMAVPVRYGRRHRFQSRHREHDRRRENRRTGARPDRVADFRSQPPAAARHGRRITNWSKLLVNRNYTPIDMAVLVAALDNMPGVEDRTVFLQRAAQIDTRSLAYFMRRHAEMLKNHQTRGAAFARFVRSAAIRSTSRGTVGFSGSCRLTL